MLTGDRIVVAWVGQAAVQCDIQLMRIEQALQKRFVSAVFAVGRCLSVRPSVRLVKFTMTVMSAANVRFQHSSNVNTALCNLRKLMQNIVNITKKQSNYKIHGK